MNDEKINNPAAFFNLLFGDELYRIGSKKTYGNTEKASIDSVSEPKPNYSSLAELFEGGAAQTLLLFNYPSSDAIPPEDQSFLNQVLQAIGLSFDKVSSLNTAKLPDDINWEAIAAQSGSDFVISFGAGKQFLPSGIEEGQIYNINNKRVLCSTALGELTANINRKKILWQCLKEIYRI